ncbi:MAG: hypothetical protein MJZ38_06495 [archaeon]|nr:hypothetical protein [archaeon]
MGAGFSDESVADTYTCSICDAVWKPKKKNGLPQRCPRCKSKLWNQCYKHTCARCNYQWASSFHSPDRCPGCQSRKWHPPEGMSEKRFSGLTKDQRIPILKRYDAGIGCVRISIDLNITFSEVVETIMDTYPDAPVRL